MDLKCRKALPPRCFDPYRKIVTHSHFDREMKGDELCAKLLQEWCSKYHVDALGVGSPWISPLNEEYLQAEHAERDLYYAGLYEVSMHREEVDDLIDRLNRGCGTLFYLDNETPKGRNGHLWYVNYHHLVPPWHDYSQDRPVKYCWNDPHEELNRITGKPHFRRPYRDVIGEQRHAGALAVWAHPTSWWHGPNGEFVTNIAAEMPLHLLLDGGIDGLTVSGYDPFHRSYRALYFMLLDRGYRIPAFAEMDLTSTCLKQEEPIATFVNAPDKPGSAETLLKHIRKNDCFIGRGIRIALDVDGFAMGESIPAEKDAVRTLKVRLEPAPGESFCSRLEITGPGGRCLASAERCEAGEYVFEFRDAGEYAYFSACAFGEHDDFRARQQKIRYFSMTNPVWLIPHDFHFPEPERMVCTIRFRPDSPFKGGIFRTPDGKIFPADIVPRTLELPANSMLELTAQNGGTFRSYPVFEDPRVQMRISDLSEGHFLKGSPGLEPGEVPASCFDPERWRPLLRSVMAVY